MAPIRLPSQPSQWSRAIIPALQQLSRAIPHPSDSAPSLSIRRAARAVSTILRRQTIVAIPETYPGLNTGPQPGTVVGIVLGTVGGILLLLWLFYTCFSLAGGGEIVEREEIVRRDSRSPRRASVTRSEILEVRSPPRRASRRDTIVVEETRTRTRSPAERDDDIVEVIEEHSPPPRRERSERLRGYRTVDPREFAGGGHRIRNMSGRQ